MTLITKYVEISVWKNCQKGEIAMSHKLMAMGGLGMVIGSIRVINTLWLEVSSEGLETAHGIATAIVGSIFALAFAALGMLGIRVIIVALRNMRKEGGGSMKGGGNGYDGPRSYRGGCAGMR